MSQGMTKTMQMPYKAAKKQFIKKTRSAARKKSCLDLVWPQKQQRERLLIFRVLGHQAPMTIWYGRSP